MFYCLLFFLVLILLLSIFSIKKNWSKSLIYMIAAYFIAMCCMLIYLSKDIYYANIITDYFVLPKILWKKLYFLKIDRFHIIRVLNWSSCAIVFFSVSFSLSVQKALQKKIGKIIIGGLLAYFIAINIIYDPSVNIWIYYKLFPDVFTFKEYQNAANVFHIFTQSVNCLILTTTIILFLRNCLHTIPVKMLQTQLLIVFISYFVMCLCYFMLLSFSPQWYLTISKAAGTYYFRPIRLSTSTLVYQMLPYLLILAAGMISIFYIRYHQFIRSLENANLEVSRQISASETTSKVFCHFIKNELLGIQSELAVLPATAENEQQIEQLLEHCRLLYDRIDSIHRSTKTSELTLKKNSLQEILHSTLNLFTQELEHINVKNYLPKESTPVLVDEHYFSQAIHNLIHNAITALDDKSKVTEFTPTLTFWLYQADKWLVFSVEDNGIGISEKNLSKIFTPFYSSKTFSEHWGIGLPLTHKIITAHDGRLQVESTYGRGSCFKIYLPNVYNIDP